MTDRTRPSRSRLEARRTRGPRLGAALVAAGALALASCASPTTSDGAAPTVRGVVVDVIDGQTIDVAVDEGDVERVRLLGITAPAVGRDGAESECFAEESRDILGERVLDERVTLTADPARDDADRDDRLLRYVDVGDVDAAEASLLAGGAREYAYDGRYDRSAVYLDAQAEAQSAGRGIWHDDCVGS